MIYDIIYITRFNVHILYLAVLGTAKVYQLDDSSGVDHDIGPFDVPVDDVVAMDIEEGVCDLPCVVGNSITIQGTKPENIPTYHMLCSH